MGVLSERREQRASKRGQSHLMAGRWEEAARAYRTAIRLKPDCAWHHNNLGAALLNMGCFAEAADAYWRVVLLEPTLAEAHVNLGAALLGLERPERAERAYARAVDLDPSNAEAMRNWGEVLERLERHDEAARVWERYSALDPDTAAESLLRAARSWTAAGRSERAGGAYAKVLEIRPGDAGAAREQATALLSLERWEEAAAVLSRRIADAPDDVWALQHYGLALLLLRRFKDADSALRRAGFLDQQDTMVRWYRLEALINDGRFEEALAVCRRLTTLLPEDPAPQWRLGSLLAHLERWAEASEALRRSAELGAPSDDLLSELGRCLFQAERFEDATAVFRELDRRRPGDPKVRSDLGAALVHLRRWDEAVEVYKAASELAPHDAVVAESLAGTLFHAQRMEEAAAAYQRCVELAPQAASLSLNLGVCLGNLRRNDEAVVALRRTVELDPTNAIAHLLLGRALSALERWTEAAGAYRRCGELDPSLEEAHAGVGTALVRARASGEAGAPGDPMEGATRARARLEEMGERARALEAWLDDLLERPLREHAAQAGAGASPNGPESPECSARCLFVLDNDYGELTTFMYLVLGQDLIARSTLLLPDRLYATNRDVVPGRTRSYSSIGDLYASVEAEDPQVVFLCSAYLIPIHRLLSLDDLESFIDFLQARGCRVATMDPFLGMLPGQDLDRLVRIVIPEAAPEALRQRRAEEEARLRHHLGECARFLGPLPHVFPACAEEAMRETAADPPLLGFFNPELVAQEKAATGQLAGADRRGDATTRPHWVFVLAAADLQAQTLVRPLGVFAREVKQILEQAVELGRHPILIGPDELVQMLQALLGQRDHIDLLTFCPFKTLIPLLLSAEYAFYWNVVSHSILIRLFNERPVFLFDRGHLVRNVESLYPRVVQWYYQGWEPLYLDPTESLSLDRLAALAGRYRVGASKMGAGYRRAPSPDALIAKLLQPSAVT